MIYEVNKLSLTSQKVFKNLIGEFYGVLIKRAIRLHVESVHPTSIYNNPILHGMYKSVTRMLYVEVKPYF